jgi:hypothetical protein
MPASSLARPDELFESFFEQGAIGASPTLTRENQPLTVYALKGMTKRRAVVLLENIFADLHDEVGPDTEDISVERPVVDRAHRNSIRNDRLTAIAGFFDVGRIEEFRAQSA